MPNEQDSPTLTEEEVVKIQTRLKQWERGEVSKQTFPVSWKEADALCCSLRAAWAERDKAIKILSPQVERTDLCDAARQIVFAHAMEKGSAEKLQERNAALRDQLARAEQRREGMAEDLTILRCKLAQVEQERDELRRKLTLKSRALVAERGRCR